MQLEVELLPQINCLVQVEMQIDQKLCMQAEWLKCSLRCCNLLCCCRSTTLCLQTRLYKLHTDEIYEEMIIVQSIEILTVFYLASLSLLYHEVSLVITVLHPLALCPSF